MTQKQKAGGALAAIVAGFGLFGAGRQSGPPPVNELDRALQQNAAVQQQRTPLPLAPIQAAPAEPEPEQPPVAVSNVERVETPAPAPPAAEQGVRVWVNTNSGIYHYPGARWYGNTREGAYMSEKEARDHGYRASRRG